MNNREIEIKLRVFAPYKEIVTYLLSTLNYKHLIKGSSKDLYWKAVDNTRADFIRLRFLNKKKGQVTLKHTDKKSTLNRVEIDLNVNNPNQAETLLKRLLNKPVGSIKKDYHVFFLNKSKDYPNISVYNISNKNHNYIEIEGTNVKVVNNLFKLLKLPFKYKKLNKSLFDLYIRKNINE